MAFEWIDRVNGKDYNLADDVNKLGNELLRVGSIADNTETNLTTEKTERMSEDNILRGEITELREVVESFGEPPQKLSDFFIPNTNLIDFLHAQISQGDKLYILNDVQGAEELEEFATSAVWKLSQNIVYGKKYIFEFVKMVIRSNPSIEDRNGLINVISVDLEDISEDISTLKTQVNQNSTDLIQEYEERTKADSLLHSLLTKARIYDYLTTGTWAGSQFVNLPVGTEFVVFNSSYDPLYPNEEVTYTKFSVNDERAYTLSSSIEPNKAYKCKIISQVDVSIGGHNGEIEVIGEFTDSDAYNEINNKLEILSAPVNHRNIFRGKNLGSTVTEAQKAAIQSGTFDDLFVGDYWEIDGTKWRIVDMDYWLNTGFGSAILTKHHLVIMPDEILYKQPINTDFISDISYINSTMYNTGLNEAKNIISNIFGDMVLSHKEYLITEVQNGKPISNSQKDSTVELPSEVMMFGTHFYSQTNDGTGDIAVSTYSKSQLSLFRIAPELIGCRQQFWMRDVASANEYSIMQPPGFCFCLAVNSSAPGVRPVFAIG